MIQSETDAPGGPLSILGARAFESLVDSVVDYAIYMLDPQGIVSTWNRGAERIKGYLPGEVIGSHFSRFYTEADRQAGMPARGLETAAQEGRFEVEGWRLRKDGSRFWASVVIDAIHDDAGKLIGFAKVTRDITERRDAASRLEETREQLFQSQKMEALGQLTGGLAHDFNNLLTAIMSGAELALRARDRPEKVESLLQSIISSAKRGGGLTRQLLAFARRQPLESKLVDLREDLPEATALVRHSLSAAIEVVTEVSDQLWAVETDPSQLQLALLNLAFNARDAMPEGGVLRIAAANVRLTGDPDGLEGDFVAISVSDTGVGIPAEVRDRVFEPFFTTKSFGQGTGLGLSQVYGFARQSKGAAKLVSEVNEGVTVTLYLPAAGRDAIGETAGSGVAGGAKVLVVEDDLVVAELADALLSELGYDTRVVHSANEALARLSREADFDLVFTDVIMPGGLSGLELATKIRERYPEMPILLTTGYSDKLGGDLSEFPLLPKPYDFEALDTALALLAPVRAKIRR